MNAIFKNFWENASNFYNFRLKIPKKSAKKRTLSFWKWESATSKQVGCGSFQSPTFVVGAEKRIFRPRKCALSKNKNTTLERELQDFAEVYRGSRALNEEAFPSLEKKNCEIIYGNKKGKLPKWDSLRRTVVVQMSTTPIVV